MSNSFDDQLSWLDATGATTLATDTIISNADPSPTYDTYRKTAIAFPNTINIRTRPTPEHEITDVGAYGLKQVASINRDQPPKLQQGRWLSCSLVDLYAFEVANAFFEANPHRAGDLCLIPSGVWFHSAEGTGQLILGRLDPNVSPLEYTYLAFPANGVGFHFFLCIITHPSDLLVARNPSGPVRTAILIFDSLGTSFETKDLRQKLELFLLKLSLGKNLRKSELKSAKLVRVPVPRQPNNCDCGLYPGHFLSVFLSDPEAYTAHCLGEVMIEGTVDSVWAANRISTARETLRSLVQMATRYRHSAVSFDSGSAPYAMDSSYGPVV